MRGIWERDDFDLYSGYPYRNTLTVTRAESANYDLLGHSATFHLREPGGDSDLLNISATLIAPPTLEIVHGSPDTLVARFEIVISAAQVATLTPGATYDFVVVMLDSRAESMPVARGSVYVARLL